MINFGSGQGAGTPAQQTDGGTPPLTRDRIVAAAVALLDESGIPGLTMRGLAERLDHGPTTLYWHVETKNEVLDLALDAIHADIAVPEPGPWRDDVATLLTRWRAVLLRHPWSAAYLPRPVPGHHALSCTEFLHRTLLRGGLTGTGLTAATHALVSFVIGAGKAETHRQAHGVTATPADDAEASRERYPTLTEHGYFGDPDWDAVFAQGLAYLLDGIERQRVTTP